MRDLCAAFLSASPGPPASEAGLVAALQALVDAGRGAWPALPLPPDVFVRYLAARLPADGDLEGSLGSVRAADLYLACACAHGVPGAVETFEASHLGGVPQVVGRIDRSPAFIDEVRQILREKLFVPDPGRGGRTGQMGRIAEYGGRGDLGGWVRTVALRVALDLRRSRGGRAESAAEDEMAAVAAGQDPELDIIKTRYRAEFRDAIQEALARLSPEQRNLLRLSLVKGLGVEPLGLMFQVAPSTITRRLASCRERVAGETRRILRERLSLTSAEFESLARMVRSQLELSLHGLLQDEEG